jgi:integrase
VTKRGQNDGSIFQRKDGRWVAALSVPERSGQVRRYAKTKAEARQRLREMQRELEAGMQLGKAPVTLAAYLDRWLQSSAKPSVRARTWEGYESIVRVRVAPRIGQTKLTDVSPAMIQSLYADLTAAGLSAHSVRRTHAMLHRAFAQAVRWGEMLRNPCDAVDPPRAGRQEMRTLSAEQVTTLLAATRHDRLHAVYALAVTTGMRLGELLGLKWSDLDLDAGRLSIRRTLQRQRDSGLTLCEPKTAQSRRTVELSRTAIAALRVHRSAQLRERLAAPAWHDHDLVFAGAAGGPLDPGGVSAGFQTALTRAGLPAVRFHDLRHTAATLCLLSGVHVKYVSEMLGHTSVVITLDTYSHVVPTMHGIAARAMDELLGA